MLRFLCLLFSISTTLIIRAQDAGLSPEKTHLYASVKEDALMPLTSYSPFVYPFSTAMVSIQPRNTRICIGLGPVYMYGADYYRRPHFFGGNLNFKVLGGSMAARHFFTGNAGIRYVQTSNRSDHAYVNFIYTWFNIYAGAGYQVFLDKKSRWLLNVTANINLNVTSEEIATQPTGPHPNDPPSNTYVFVTPSLGLELGYRFR